MSGFRTKIERKSKSSTFDIIAGISIGAINAAILTSYVVKNGTYEGSAERLVEFWTYLKNQWLISIPGLLCGGKPCMVSTKLLQKVRQLEDITQRKNFRFQEYQMFFYPLHLFSITSF